MLAQRFALSESDLIDRERLRFHESLGLVWREGDRIGATAEGMPLLEALLGELVPETLAAA